MTAVRARILDVIIGAVVGGALTGAASMFFVARRLDLVEYRLRQVECAVSIGDCRKEPSRGGMAFK